MVEPGAPAIDVKTNSDVGIGRRTLGEPYAVVYAALLRQRCHADGRGSALDTLAEQPKLHLH